MNEVTLLVMPSYGGGIRPEVGAAFWAKASKERRLMARVGVASALTRNFNDLWCYGLNVQRSGVNVKYFAMLHDDISPASAWWLDVLITELERGPYDVVSSAMAIKDERGLSSCGLGDPNDATRFNPLCRFSMRELATMPETFTASDIGHHDKVLLINTGCWVCRFDQPWRFPPFCFDIDNAITLNADTGEYESCFEPEDWKASRSFHRSGLRVAVTRKVPARHWGAFGYPNDKAWGTKHFDSRLTARSLVINEAKADAKSEGQLNECFGVAT